MGSFAKRILVWMAVVGLFPFFVLAIPEYHFAEKVIVHSEETYLRSVLQEHATHVQEWLRNTRQDLIFAGQSNCVQGICTGACPTKTSEQGCPFLDAILKSHNAYLTICALKQDWTVISQVGTTGLCSGPPSARLKELVAGTQDFVIAPDYCYEDGHTILEVGQSIPNPTSGATAYVVANLNLSDAVLPLIEDRTHRKTEKIYIISQDGQYVLPPMGHHELWKKESIFTNGLSGIAPGRVLKYKDFRDVPVLGAYIRIPDSDWLLVAEIDQAVAFHWLNRLTFRTGLAGLLTLVVVVIVSFLVSKKLSAPLQELADAAQGVSAGKHWLRVPRYKEKEVREVGEAFNHMLDRLKASQNALIRSASLAAIGELSSSIVHEMRGPLSSIKMNLQALGRKSHQDTVCQEMSEIALRQSDRLENLLENLLHYGKPLELHLEKVMFGELVKDVLDIHGSKAEEKKLIVRVEENFAEEQLYIDRELMIRALSNLIANAIDWSPPGGTLQINAGKDYDTPEMFTIVVKDDGPGIAPLFIQKIFKPFFTTREEGTGLGLANAKKIVEYHGGGISVENDTSGGAIFSIILPLKGPIV